MMTKQNERHMALKIVEEFDKNEVFINQILDNYFYVYDMEKQQRSFITRLVYGTIENLGLIDFYINQVSKTPTRKMKAVIRWILRLSVYQLFYMDQVPARATINEAVRLVQKRRMIPLKGFVNGVLRNIDRQKDTLIEAVNALDGANRLCVRYSINKALIEYLAQYYDLESLESYLKSTMDFTSTTARVNTLQANSDELKRKLSARATIEDGVLFHDAFRLSGYDRLSSIDEFQEGYFQIQDESSMSVTYVANPSKGSKILDACAAPGGKTTHLAQWVEDSASIIACDVSESKLERIKENLERLHIKSVELVCKDASEFEPSYESSFDLVLADVPCSGLGILRKKPDIKQNMIPDKIYELIKIQKAILDNLSRYVKVGGELIYSTCTINPMENEKQIQGFIESHPEFEKIDLFEQLSDRGLSQLLNFTKEGMLQFRTDLSGTDGFFVAKLRRIG